jgi:glycosyltransferase involved in cell wall biosynthesis
VSSEDRQALLEAVGEEVEPRVKSKIVTIPIAVDTQALQPVSRAAEYQITTLGTLYYPPNADGIRWFAREVFPLIQAEVPRTTFTIVGKRPPEDFYQLAEDNPGVITVAGYLPDLTSCLEKTAVLVVPVRSGGGMRVRILEALARGVPVVTTTTGAEGIQVRPGEDILIADTPVDFARAVIDLLKSPQLQQKLAQNGRSLAVARYDWQAVLPVLDEVYMTLAGIRS